MYCHACGMSLNIPGFKGRSDKYCSHCTDESGQLNVTKAELQETIANWFMEWQPDLDKQTAMKRSDLYLRAMPEWAEE
jgi:hypothetical protein